MFSQIFLEKQVLYEPLYESSMNVVCYGDPLTVDGREMNPVEDQQECEKSCSSEPRCKYFKFVHIVYGSYYGCKLFPICETTVNTLFFGRIYMKKDS